jgi:hypothetical protein
VAEGVVDSSLVATAMVLSLLSRLNCHNESHNPGFCALLGFALDGRSFAFGAVVALVLTTAAVMHHEVRLRKAPLGASYVRLAGLRLMRATFALLAVAATTLVIDVKSTRPPPPPPPSSYGHSRKLSPDVEISTHLELFSNALDATTACKPPVHCTLSWIRREKAYPE